MAALPISVPEDAPAQPAEGEPRHRRRRHHHRRRRRPPRVRMRFSWWQLWAAALCIVLAGALVLLLKPWQPASVAPVREYRPY